MTERDLDELIHRYQTGLATPEEVAFLDSLQHSQLTELPQNYAASPRQLAEVGERVWKNLLDEVQGPPSLKVTIGRFLRTQPRVWAASVLVLLGVGLIPFLLPFVSDREYVLFASNESAAVPKSVTLPDSSKVILEGSSSISLHRSFDKSERRVKLSGSAFFDVVRSPQKPFIIQTGELLTKVLGTSFAIKNSETSAQIEVKVYTGRVSVQVSTAADKAANQELLLTPNLKAVFHKDSRLLRETLDDNPTILASESPAEVRTFLYRDQKIAYILRQIEDAYQINIILLNEDDGNRLLTGDLGNLTLHQKLNLICSATDLRYEIKGSKIILKPLP